MKINELKYFSTICLINLCCVGAMGLLLRYGFIGSSFGNYYFLLQAHSHLGILGWCFSMVYVFFVFYFFDEKDIRLYKSLFWILQFSIIGMFVSFLFQGYGAVSISFLSIHLMVSYLFSFLLWKRGNHEHSAEKLCVRIAILFFLFSTLGIWLTAVSASLFGKSSLIYKLSPHFYVHYFLNGWMTFSLIALLMRCCGKPAYGRRFLSGIVLLALSVLTSFVLEISWYFPAVRILSCINVLSALIQCVAIFLLVMEFIKSVKQKDLILNTLYTAVVLFVSLKAVIQCFALFESLKLSVSSNRNLQIGFLHLFTLGMTTTLLFAFIYSNLKKYLNRSFFFIGILLFLAGFILTEILLFWQGMQIIFNFGFFQKYYLYLFVSNVIIFLGVSAVLTAIVKGKSN